MKKRNYKALLIAFGDFIQPIIAAVVIWSKKYEIPRALFHCLATILFAKVAIWSRHPDAILRWSCITIATFELLRLRHCYFCRFILRRLARCAWCDLILALARRSGITGLTQRLIKCAMRKEEHSQPMEMLPISFALWIAYRLLPIERFWTVTLIIALADPAARIIGKCFGQKRLWWNSTKTYVGFSAGWGVATLASLTTGMSPGGAVLLGLVASTAESVGRNGSILKSDNFLVPFFTTLTICALAVV